MTPMPTDTSNIATPEHHHTLADSELDGVTGGSSLGNAVDAVIKSIGGVNTPVPPDVWVGCAWVPQWW